MTGVPGAERPGKIADRLPSARGTVEGHLPTSEAKLGIRSKFELMGRASDLPLDDRPSSQQYEHGRDHGNVRAAGRPDPA